MNLESVCEVNSASCVSTVAPWYVLCTRPCRELDTSERLRNMGIESYVPTYNERRRWSDRHKVIVVPLFTGYVFCQFDLEHRARIFCANPWVVSQLQFAGAPAVVTEEEIAQMRAIVESGARPSCCDIRPGDAVRVRVAGAEIDAVVERVAGEERVVVNFYALGRGVSLKVDREMVKRAA